MEVKPCRPRARRHPKDMPVKVHLTREQLQTAIRLATKSASQSASSLLKKLIAARAQADYPRSTERAARLKNWR